MHASEANPLCAHRLNEYADVIDIAIRFAFQPVVDVDSGETVAHEALVRGSTGESAAEVIAGIRVENLFYFDQACRLRAIRDFDAQGLDTDLHLNCTEIDPENIEFALASTARAVTASRLEPERIVLEFSSLNRLGTPRQLAEVRRSANRYGFRVLADNYGTGEAGLKRLAVLEPEYVKLDRELITGVHRSRRRQAMVMGIIATCKVLGVEVIASGVEEADEICWLRAAGVGRFQGYYYGRPEITRSRHAAPAGASLQSAAQVTCAA